MHDAPDDGSGDAAYVKGLQWLLSSKPGLDAVVSNQHALYALWEELARTTSPVAQLHHLRLLSCLAGFSEGYPQIPRLFQGRWGQIERFFEPQAPIPILAQALILTRRMAVTRDEAIAALPKLVAALCQRPAHTEPIVDDILQLIRRALMLEPPPPRDTIDVALGAWVKLGFDPASPLYLAQPAIEYLEEECKRTPEDIRSLVQRHQILQASPPSVWSEPQPVCLIWLLTALIPTGQPFPDYVYYVEAVESYCERLLPQGLLHQGSGVAGDFTTVNHPFGKGLFPGEVNPSPRHGTGNPSAEAADFRRAPTPSEQRAAVATVARGMGLVRLQRRLFLLLDSLVQSEDAVVRHEVARRVALPSLLLRVVRMFRKVTTCTTYLCTFARAEWTRR